MKVKLLVTSGSPAFCDPVDCSCQGPLPLNSPGTLEGCHSLPPGIFPAQRLNPGLQHSRFSTIWATREALCQMPQCKTDCLTILKFSSNEYTHIVESATDHSSPDFFHLPELKLYTHLTTAYSLPTQLLVTAILLSVSVNLTALRTLIIAQVWVHIHNLTVLLGLIIPSFPSTAMQQQVCLCN